MANTPVSGIYEIVNLKTGRRYIGSTARLSIRFLQHRSKLRQGTHDNTLLQAAWNKHGEASFVYRTLELCAEDQLLIVEQRWLDLIQGNGEKHYNIAPFANSGAKGRSPSAETRAKQSASVKATYDTEKRAKHSMLIKERHAQLGYSAKNGEAIRDAWEKLTDEEKAKNIAARAAWGKTPEGRAQKSAESKMRYADPEYKARHAEASRIANAKPERRAKLSAAGMGRTATEETKAKLSASISKALSDPAVRQKYSDARRAAWADPEIREKMIRRIRESKAAKKSLILITS